MASPSQKASKPKGITGRSLAVDGKDLFSALAKGVMHSFQGKWDEVASDSIDAVKALGIGTEPPAIAYILIRRAATASMFELVGETAKSGFFGTKPYASSTKTVLDFTISEHDIPIDKAFFQKPTELKVVKSFQALLCRWLELMGLEAHIANAVGGRFPAYYLYALNEEWKKHSKLYQPLLDSTDTPFQDASNQMWAWQSYASRLELAINESTFEEAFSLKQIYVPLRAYYEVFPIHKELDGMDKRKRTKRIVELKNELSTWLGNGKKDDAIRIISGGPGSGKSSFAKIFAAHIANSTEIKVLFIPLHRFDSSKDLTEAVGDFVTEENILPHNPLSPTNGETNLLIIFDGLDELASQGKAAVETARAFVREVDLTLEKRNSQTLKLRAIISGREMVLQDNETEFSSRRPHQLLTLLPYYIEEEVNDDDNNEEEIIDPDDLYDYDQRDIWWQQYGELTGKKYEGLPKHLDRDDLNEVTSQPLLNYLVALSYTRGALDFTKAVNLNKIYADLVSSVHERAYENKRRYTQIEGMTLESFARVLEEVGLAAWHGDGRTTTVREIEEHCFNNGLDRHLKTFEQGAKAGVLRLLAAFFFRQYGRRSSSGDATFMFTHKSFGEYLTARRIVRAMEKVAKERDNRRESSDEGWDEREALWRWVQLAGPSPMTSYLFRFVQNELRLKGKAKARKIQSCFAELFSLVLRSGMPMEQLPRTTFKQENFMARNAEEALLVCMSACARVTQEISPISHATRLVFGAWFRRVQGQRYSPASALAAYHLDFLNLEETELAVVDFYSANLSNSVLRGAEVQHAIFIQANLNYTNMEGVKADGASFEDATLIKTNLEKAKLLGANFSAARFHEVNLNGARMHDGALEHAIIRDTVTDAVLFELHPAQVASIQRAANEEMLKIHREGLLAEALNNVESES
ncbi:pentapeptide repeat-containing protein [Hymenobacter sp. BT683]|uniref:Pentapeptide repeat-containing protein n=1 Tax=Hymenobacter jeongseonensis TaxID=2791027 RepID=A0ABS0IMA8_9BACT|nr:pentapeptide repeat-containing protein [Hymenobacter jeongseonensis]MBF9239504.1 pentapeptide repeat-containing protein [Hymenobacter jeongseonensis]